MPFTCAMNPIRPLPSFCLWESNGSWAVLAPALSWYLWNVPAGPAACYFSEAALMHRAGWLLLTQISEDLTAAVLWLSSVIFRQITLQRQGNSCQTSVLLWGWKRIPITSRSCDKNAFIYCLFSAFTCFLHAWFFMYMILYTHFLLALPTGRALHNCL